jgi:tight adherence protein C
MTSLLFPVALMVGFGGATLFAYSIAPKRRPVDVRSLAARAVDRSKLPLWLRLSLPVANMLLPLAQMVGWKRHRATLATGLERAGIGEVVSVDQLMSVKLLAAVVTPLFAAQVLPLFANPAMFLVAAIGGFVLPDRLVADLRKKRDRQILRSLPGAVDMLSLSVEAGLEFLIAIHRLVERGAPGPLRDELAVVLNDIRLGKSRADALKAFGARVEVADVSSFVSVLVQADALGASIGPVLKSQAERMRVERFQRAEREGARANQKILFPLVLCIFPAVLIVILGPTILRFIYGGM